MFKTLKRASILLSALVLATMLTSTDLVSQGADSRPELAKRGEALLQAVDFRFSDGLAQLSLKTGPDDVYILRMDLAEAVVGLQEPVNYRLALVLLGLWVFSPVIFSVMKRSRKQAPHAAATSRKPSIGVGAKDRYHRIHGLTVNQLARGLQGIVAVGGIAGPPLIHLIKGNVRVKRYRPRHAVASRRQKTMIIETPKSDSFAA